MASLTLSRMGAVFVFGALAFTAWADEAAIELYTGYGDRTSLLIEGRVVEPRAASPRTTDDGWFTNLWRTLRRFGNEEIDNFPLQVTLGGQTWSAKTDEEGYFRLDLAHVSLPLGWNQISASAADGKVTAQGEVLVVDGVNSVGVISDIDDTLLVSNVNRKATLLANTFLKNALQRVAVPGAAQFIRNVLAQNSNADAAPVIYLSASPRQLYGNISEFLAHQDFPRGVLIAKRVTEDKTSDPLFDQFAYKTAKIAEIFRRLPNHRFVLMGDDGEKDPEIYRDIAQRFPTRVAAVFIRKVNPDPNRIRFPEQQDFEKGAEIVK